jgi:hypothetical protein
VKSNGLTGVRRRSPESSKRRTCVRDRMACVEATQGAVAGHPSDGENTKNSISALEGLGSLVSREGHFRHSVASI